MINLYISSCTKNNEHVVARQLAEGAVNKLFGREATLSHDERGKPYFSGEDKIFVSISHSEGRCMAVISDSQIGGDIEYMKGGEERLLRLADRYFCPDEVEYVRPDPCRRFYEIWCKKESYIKYTGEGFSRRLDSFSVLNMDGVNFSVCDKDGYMIAVCSEDKAEFSLDLY